VTSTPAIEGWFHADPVDPHLIGTRCAACGTVYFPAERRACRNPVCGSGELTEVPLSQRGRVWSYTNACYAPPPPYVATTDPYEPFTIAAVELADEGFVVLGQCVAGVGVQDLTIGTEVELVIDTLFTDDDGQHTVWKWRPVSRPVESAAR
jgi:uncharacterized OB-fold protein